MVSNNQLDSPDKSALAMPENSDIVSSHSKENVRSRSPSDIDPEPYYPPRPVSHDSGGVNFYLRLGAIGKYKSLTRTVYYFLSELGRYIVVSIVHGKDNSNNDLRHRYQQYHTLLQMRPIFSHFITWKLNGRLWFSWYAQCSPHSLQH